MTRGLASKDFEEGVLELEEGSKSRSTRRVAGVAEAVGTEVRVLPFSLLLLLTRMVLLL